MIGEVAETVALHVHTEDFPVGRLENALGEVVANEAVDTQDQDFFHE
jgi:hypothetical protein